MPGAGHDDDRSIFSHALLIDGRDYIPVALTLARQQIVYSNDHLEQSIAVLQIDELEYISDLVTGAIADGAVLRLWWHGRAVEFVLDMASAVRWSALLPPHQMIRRGSVHSR